MKKLMFALGVIACAVQAQAISHVVYRIQLPREYSSVDDSCLSDVDHETENTSDKSLGQEPSIAFQSFGIKKKGSNPTIGILADGYSVYLIKNTSYDGIVAALKDASLWGFRSDYKSALINESYEGKDEISNLYYGADSTNPSQKHLSIQFTYMADGTAAYDGITTQEDASKAVAVMVFENKAGSEAQYLVSAFNHFDAENVWFVGDPNEKGEGLTTTGWVTFASIPEPTSGMLMLLGLAGLCLRRKQK